jgi:N-acetylmuramoyl-L-alanine amidase
MQNMNPATPSSTPPPGATHTQPVPNPTEAPQARPHTKSNTFHYIQAVLAVAFVVATLFTTWIPSGLLSSNQLEEEGGLEVTSQTSESAPTTQPELRIGIIAGHWGSEPYDPGAVCSTSLQGTQEIDVNYGVATRVQAILTEQGYQVDLLKEFDERLSGYRALALIALHTDSCEFVNEQATGFKISGSSVNYESARLAACLQNRYASATGLALHPGITPNMTNYHTFYEADPQTPTAILELGFLNLDHTALTNKQGLLATGVANGILCFLLNENPSPENTATP